MRPHRFGSLVDDLLHGWLDGMAGGPDRGVVRASAENAETFAVVQS